MKKGIIGKKIGMTQLFDEKGNVIPVTVIEAGPCVVAQKKTVEKDGYSSVQLGFEDIAERKLNKAEKGHFAKAGVANKKHLKEFRLDDAETMNVGDVINNINFSFNLSFVCTISKICTAIRKIRIFWNDSTKIDCITVIVSF